MSLSITLYYTLAITCHCTSMMCAVFVTSAVFECTYTSISCHVESEYYITFFKYCILSLSLCFLHRFSYACRLKGSWCSGPVPNNSVTLFASVSLQDCHLHTRAPKTVSQWDMKGEGEVDLVLLFSSHCCCEDEIWWPTYCSTSHVMPPGVCIWYIQ